jgi:hypothetical protein
LRPLQISHFAHFARRGAPSRAALSTSRYCVASRHSSSASLCVYVRVRALGGVMFCFSSNIEEDMPERVEPV